MMCSEYQVTISFNPCFDGSVARGSWPSSRARRSAGFNPCFDGSVARGPLGLRRARDEARVSILVLMEV